MIKKPITKKQRADNVKALERAIKVWSENEGLGWVSINLFAKALGMTGNGVRYWLQHDGCPTDYAKNVELATNGKVTRKDLRSDTF